MKPNLLAPVLLASFVSLVTVLRSRAPACGGYGSAKPAAYVAHEWGTFTSVQASEGVQPDWNPLAASDLPSFVYDLAKLRGTTNRAFHYYFGKSAFRMIQRMETPVIYFYTDREQDVAVKVNFPQGRITEWYPQLAPETATNFWARPQLLDWGRARSGSGASSNRPRPASSGSCRDRTSPRTHGTSCKPPASPRPPGSPSLRSNFTRSTQLNLNSSTP
jgi:hypothetical protein